MMKCSVCHKNVAVIFMTRINKGGTDPVGMGIPCAQKQGVAPLNELLAQSGMSQHDFENLNEQMSGMFGQVDMESLMSGMAPHEPGQPEDTEEGGPPHGGEPSAPLMQFLQSALSAMNPSAGGSPLEPQPEAEAPASGEKTPPRHRSNPQGPRRSPGKGGARREKSGRVWHQSQ